MQEPNMREEGRATGNDARHAPRADARYERRKKGMRVSESRDETGNDIRFYQEEKERFFEFLNKILLKGLSDCLFDTLQASK